jgi:hypothetical protein
MPNNGWSEYGSSTGMDSASGAAGGLAIKYVASPSATETITVGAGGNTSTNTAGSSNLNGINGLPGYIIVEEYS